MNGMQSPWWFVSTTAGYLCRPGAGQRHGELQQKLCSVA